jgi:adenylate cyclase
VVTGPFSGTSSALSPQEAIAQIESFLDRLTDATSARRSGIFARSQPLEEEILQAQQGLSQLERALLAQKEEHQQLQAIQQVSRAVASSLDQDKVLNMVMDTIIQLTGAERGFLMLLDPDTGKLTFRVARNMDRETIHKSSFKISRSIVNQVAQEGKPIVTTNAQADPRFSAQESVVSYSLRSILCVPLKVRDELIGVIYADNRIVTGLFDDKDRDLLDSFASQAAIAIHNAGLFLQVSEQLRAITAMKNLMDNVFASIASGVITTDVENKITLFNRAAETILGISSKQVEGRPYDQSLPGLKRSLTELVNRVKTEDTSRSMEVETELAERGQVNLNLHLSPLKDAQNDTLGVALVVDDLTEKRRREKMMAHVRRYLPPALVDSLTDLENLQLGGTRRTISILFGDVRGFSTFSERQVPEQVVDVINRYFTVAADAILLHEGVIDKFMGDAVMALFNTPFLEQEDHALRAVRAALAVQYDLVALREQTGGDLQLEMGIGINTGEAVLGNIGSPDRLDFSAIGDAVNVAKRLQEVARPGQILISQATYDQTKEWVEVIPLEPVQVKGRQTLEQVYELVGLVVPSSKK